MVSGVIYVYDIVLAELFLVVGRWMVGGQSCVCWGCPDPECLV